MYLVSSFRWSFYGIAYVHIGLRLTMTSLLLAIVAWMFRTGYRLKQ